MKCILFLFVALTFTQGLLGEKCKETGKADECPDETTQVTRKKVTSSDSLLDITLKCYDSSGALIYTCESTEKNPFPNVHVTSYQFHGSFAGPAGPTGTLPVTIYAKPKNKDREVVQPSKYDDVETFD